MIIKMMRTCHKWPCTILGCEGHWALMQLDLDNFEWPVKQVMGSITFRQKRQSSWFWVLVWSAPQLDLRPHQLALLEPKSQSRAGATTFDKIWICQMCTCTVSCYANSKSFLNYLLLRVAPRRRSNDSGKRTACYKLICKDKEQNLPIEI